MGKPLLYFSQGQRLSWCRWVVQLFTEFILIQWSGQQKLCQAAGTMISRIYAKCYEKPVKILLDKKTLSYGWESNAGPPVSQVDTLPLSYKGFCWWARSLLTDLSSTYQLLVGLLPQSVEFHWMPNVMIKLLAVLCE